jgi:hypothetical protein
LPGLYLRLRHADLEMRKQPRKIRARQYDPKTQSNTLQILSPRRNAAKVKADSNTLTGLKIAAYLGVFQAPKNHRGCKP